MKTADTISAPKMEAPEDEPKQSSTSTPDKSDPQAPSPSTRFPAARPETSTSSSEFPTYHARSSARITTTYTAEDDEHQHQGREFRRRSLVLAQMAGINNTSANFLRQRNTADSSSLGPNSAESTACNTGHISDADILPLLNPSAQMAQQSPDAPYHSGREKSISAIAERAFCLGMAFSLGLTFMLWIVIATPSPLWRLPFFLSALSLFHFLEFWTTAKYNTPQAAVSSFLLTSNGRAYLIAHASSFVEALVVGLLFPERRWAPFHSGPILMLLGLLLAVAGQTVRSTAMIQCGNNFNHTIQHRRAKGHELVTTGIYATMRHPSYFGYFWWALGTQFVMGNIVCFFGFAIVLWRFFRSRIIHEEELLVRFFGEDYVQYRRYVGTKIPFIP